MKNLVLTAISILFCTFIQAQTVRKELNEMECGPLSCKNTMTIENGKDTSYYVWCGFQNEKYNYITDIGSVMFLWEEDITEFISDLNKMKGYLDSLGNDVDIRKRRYELLVYPFNTELYIQSDGKYATISKTELEMLVEWLVSVKLPKRPVLKD